MVIMKRLIDSYMSLDRLLEEGGRISPLISLTLRSKYFVQIFLIKLLETVNALFTL